MDADEKLEQARLCKEKGTGHFRAAKYAPAIKQYKKIVTYLEFEKSTAVAFSFFPASRRWWRQGLKLLDFCLGFW